MEGLCRKGNAPATKPVQGVTRDRSPLNWLASGGIPFSTKPFQKLCLPTFPTTQVLVSKWTFIRKQVWEISLSRRSSLLTNPYLLCEDCQSVSFYSGHRLSSTPRLISLNLLEATPMLNNLQKFCVQIYFFRNTPSVTHENSYGRSLQKYYFRGLLSLFLRIFRFGHSFSRFSKRSCVETG